MSVHHILFTTIITPEIISKTITRILTVFSLRILLLFIPKNNPISINGNRIIACFMPERVNIPSTMYRIILKLFSTMKTALILALNSSLLLLTLPIYAARSAPTPNNPQSTPDRTPITPRKILDSFNCSLLNSLKRISVPIKTTMIPNTIFIYPGLTFFNKTAPIMLPIKTRIESGIKIALFSLFLFFHVRIRFVG